MACGSVWGQPAPTADQWGVRVGRSEDPIAMPIVSKEGSDNSGDVEVFIGVRVTALTGEEYAIGGTEGALASPSGYASYRKHVGVAYAHSWLSRFSRFCIPSMK